MSEYFYKGFKVNYNIQKSEDNIYQATAEVTRDPDYANDLVKVFQTERSTQQGVEKEIKKMIQEYINFEWKEYLGMKS